MLELTKVHHLHLKGEQCPSPIHFGVSFHLPPPPPPPPSPTYHPVISRTERVMSVWCFATDNNYAMQMNKFKINFLCKYFLSLCRVLLFVFKDAEALISPCNGR